MLETTIDKSAEVADYKAEIIESHRHGLGSSDAAMVEHIGLAGAISYAESERIAVMLGQAAPTEITTPAMELGNRVEMLVLDLVRQRWPQAVSNPNYKSAALSKRYGFDIFDHIDYEVVTDDQLIWIENKATAMATTETFMAYGPQLRWHQMLLNEKAAAIGKKPALMLSHYDTRGLDPRAEIDALDKDLFEVLPILEVPSTDAIEKGLEFIKNAIPTFSWKPKAELTEAELPVAVRAVIQQLADDIKKQSALEAEISDFKAKMLALMEQSNVKKISNDLFSLTYKAPTTSVRFDSKSFKEAHPDLYSQYQTTSAISASILLTLKKTAIINQ